VPNTSRDVNNHAAMELDGLIVEHHSSLAIDDVVKLVSALMIVELRVLDLDVVDLARGAVSFLDEAADLAACLRPRFHLRWISPQAC
jgi:hypothetical protein